MRRSQRALAFGLFIAAGCGARSGLSALDLAPDNPPTLPCQNGVFRLQRANPALLLVIDRSRSMLEPMASSGVSRWGVLRSALRNTLPAADGSLEIGALLFPARGTNDMSCVVTSSPDLAPALNHVEPLLALLGSTSPGGATPTADAISSAARALNAVRAAKSARALLLATDGAPDCNSKLDPRSCTCLDGARSCTAIRCLDSERSVANIESAAKLGLPTYVIGLQDEESNANSVVLDAMADAGGRAQVGATHHYYAATSESELSQALVKVRDQVGACTFLTSSVPNAKGSIVVSIDGIELPFDGTGQTGWNWIERENGELLFAPEACTAALNAQSVQATLACAEP